MMVSSSTQQVLSLLLLVLIVGCNGFVAFQHSHRTTKVAERHHLNMAFDGSFPFHPSRRPPPQQGGDMAYTIPNIKRQHETFEKIRRVATQNDVRDVYVSNIQLPTQFWYIGKLALTGGTVSLEQALLRQWNMIQEHSARIRPVELGHQVGNLLVWTAPYCSELEMEQNLIDLDGPWMKHPDDDLYEDLDLRKPELSEVGFFCEYVTSRGKMFHVRRNPDGTRLTKGGDSSSSKLNP